MVGATRNLDLGVGVDVAVVGKSLLGETLELDENGSVAVSAVGKPLSVADVLTIPRPVELRIVRNILARVAGIVGRPGPLGEATEKRT